MIILLLEMMNAARKRRKAATSIGSHNELIRIQMMVSNKPVPLLNS